MKPLIHAKNSVRKWGGIVTDYLGIHNFIDISKSSHPDMRHRAILHSSLGCYITERMFGIPIEKFYEYSKKFNWSEEEQAAIKELINIARTDGATSLINSDQRRVEVRDIAEEHIIEDMGRIPTVSDYLNDMPMYNWLGGNKREPVRRIISLVD